MKFNNYDDSPRENPPEKTYPARLIGIYDIGKQPGFDEGDPAKAQLVFTYELLGKEKTSEGKNFCVSEFLTVSLNAKATLVKRLQTMKAPIKKKSDDWYTIPDNYSLSELLGDVCMVVVKHNTKGNAKVDSVIEPMEGLTIAEATNELGYLDLDGDEDISQLEAAPEWIKKKVAARIK